MQEGTGRKYANKVKPRGSKEECQSVAVEKKLLPEAVQKGVCIPLYGEKMWGASEIELKLEFQIRVLQDS